MPTTSFKTVLSQAPFVKYKRAAFLDDGGPVAMSLNLRP